MLTAILVIVAFAAGAVSRPYLPAAWDWLFKKIAGSN